MSRWCARLALAAALLTACAPGGPAPRPVAHSPSPAPTSAPSPPGPSPVPAALAEPGAFNYALTVAAGGLTVPWAVDFAPDGAAWITERPGTVRVLRDGNLAAAPALTLAVVAQPGCEGGLLGLALKAPSAYVYYTRAGAGGPVNRISRFTMEGDRLTGEQVVLDGIPAGSCYHDGGRLKFGPDGLLYFTNGEGFVAARAADPGGLSGKVMRLHPDGTGLEMVGWGFRNPQGLAWDGAGRLYASSNGPTGDLGLCCHDELDLVRDRAFYGWPDWAGTQRTSFGGSLPARVPPLAESGSTTATTWAPSGLAFFAGARGERPALFMAELKGEALRRFVLDPSDPAKVLSSDVVMQGQGRLRDVVAGPDGCLYVTTSDRDGRGSPRAGDDRLLRLCPR